ncbi:Malonyl-[acyl-carrier protein] O-methyltransferase [hydrothermal vent metagenome]|uniref:malonyl-[acyl-carrier protein] O-methyltransferase n=1 Tax=hydrothermal vent metagenome TaxID=652676 RepID=A0A3B1C603_9ZZZZ
MSEITESEIKQESELESLQVQRSFEQAAASYDEAAILQREVGSRLLERLDYIRFTPRRILDLGAGTGYCQQSLALRYPQAEIHALDIALGMLKQARKKISWLRRLKRRDYFVNANAAILPFADNSMDMIVSNLTLQWCTDLVAVFSECRRVLKPGGMLLFSNFGPDTLKELRQCWAKIDVHTHVNKFADMHDMGDAMLQSGFSDPVVDMEMITVTYKNLRGIMRDLKQIGAHNVTRGRSRGLTGKGRLQQLQQAYEAYRQQDRLPVTHEVVYGLAWCNDNMPGKNNQPAEIYISTDMLKK